jgi:hypothetical protein
MYMDHIIGKPILNCSYYKKQGTNTKHNKDIVYVRHAFKHTLSQTFLIFLIVLVNTFGVGLVFIDCEYFLVKFSQVTEH